MFVLIFVCAGSRGYPFDRLLKKLDALCETGVITQPLFVQTGKKTYTPRHYEYKDFISQEEFIMRIETADIIITHAASGTVMKALNAGKKTIVVPRRVEFGEHVHDHQVQAARAYGETGCVLTVFDMEELGAAIQALQNNTIALKRWVNPDPESVVKLIDSFITK
ncbi:MAG: glycosyl transferase [Clostridia bacterium]|nr:glycosyl transferase [Clostridia bacterium]